MVPVSAKYLKTHTSANNSTDYTPVFTDASYNNTPGGSIGSISPSYYGVHNYSANQDVTIWTIDQGTSGSGATIRINQGDTFFAHIAKISVTNPVVLLGTTNLPGLL